jgi:hypothetical protein
MVEWIARVTAGRLATQGAADHMILRSETLEHKRQVMADPVVISIPHRLGRVEARRRVEAGIDQVVAPLGRLVSIDRRVWTGDRFDFGMSVAGQTAHGLVDVEDTQVRIELELPWVLAAVAKRVRGVIDQRGRGLLEKK